MASTKKRAKSQRTKQPYHARALCSKGIDLPGVLPENFTITKLELSNIAEVKSEVEKIQESHVLLFESEIIHLNLAKNFQQNRVALRRKNLLTIFYPKSKSLVNRLKSNVTSLLTSMSSPEWQTGLLSIPKEILLKVLPEVSSISNLNEVIYMTKKLGYSSQMVELKNEGKSIGFFKSFIKSLSLRWRYNMNPLTKSSL